MKTLISTTEKYRRKNDARPAAAQMAGMAERFLSARSPHKTFVQQATLCCFGSATRHRNALFGEPQSDYRRDNQNKIADDRTPGFQVAQPEEKHDGTPKTR